MELILLFEFKKRNGNEVVQWGIYKEIRRIECPSSSINGVEMPPNVGNQHIISLQKRNKDKQLQDDFSLTWQYSFFAPDDFPEDEIKTRTNEGIEIVLKAFKEEAERFLNQFRESISIPA